MTTQPAPAAECEHPEDMRIWLSVCCERTYLAQLIDFDGETNGLCVCWKWVSFSLVCDCGATVEATGEVT